MPMTGLSLPNNHCQSLMGPSLKQKIFELLKLLTLGLKAACSVSPTLPPSPVNNIERF